MNYILEKEDTLLETMGSGLLEDIVPFIRHFYKTKAFKSLEDFSDEIIDGFLGKKFEDARSTFDRSMYIHYIGLT